MKYTHPQLRYETNVSPYQARHSLADGDLVLLSDGSVAYLHSDLGLPLVMSLELGERRECEPDIILYRLENLYEITFGTLCSWGRDTGQQVGKIHKGDIVLFFSLDDEVYGNRDFSSKMNIMGREVIAGIAVKDWSSNWSEDILITSGEFTGKFSSGPLRVYRGGEETIKRANEVSYMPIINPNIDI